MLKPKQKSPQPLIRNHSHSSKRKHAERPRRSSAGLFLQAGNLHLPRLVAVSVVIHVAHRGRRLLPGGADRYSVLRIHSALGDGGSMCALHSRLWSHSLGRRSRIRRDGCQHGDLVLLEPYPAYRRVRPLHDVSGMTSCSSSRFGNGSHLGGRPFPCTALCTQDPAAPTMLL